MVAAPDSPFADAVKYMDPATRRAIMECFSAPTNPVGGVVLRHILQRVSYAAMQTWQKSGWIAREASEYVLTNLGAAAMRAQRPAPPESYFPVPFNPETTMAAASKYNKQR